MWKRVLKDGPFGDEFTEEVSDGVLRVLKKISAEFLGNLSEEVLT